MIGRRLSIRLRLTLWNTAVLLIILSLVFLGVFFIIRNRLEAGARGRLTGGLTNVLNVVASSGGDLADVYHLGQEQIFQLVHGGRVIYQTLTWQEKLLPEAGMGPDFKDFGVWRSPEGALYWLQKGREALSGIEIILAQDVTSTGASIKNLALILAAAIPFALLLALWGGYFLAGRALSPVKVITRKAGEINADNLSERLPLGNPGDEIGRLAFVFNETLARLEESFQRLRRFTSDASHELRTPLTSIRSVGEVALQETKDVTSYREAIGSMLEETERLTHLVDNLLTLARGDAGKARLDPHVLDLGALALDVFEELTVLAEEKRQVLTSGIRPAMMVKADLPTLRLAVANVLHNAIVHTPEGGHIEVRTAEMEGGRVVIDISDDGPGIAESERQRVFERFYRVKGARSRQDGGAGLGLAIARWAVESNGGTISFVDKKDPGALCRLSFPGFGEKKGART